MDQHIHDQDTGRSEGTAGATFVGEGRVPDPGAGGPDRQPSRTHGRARGWIEVDDGGVLTVARAHPARFDLSVGTVVPPVASRRRLAHQVRQDMWRVLRDLRGFSPAVRVTPEAAGLRLTAGGAVATASFPRARCEAALRDLLDDPAARARWIRCAGGGRDA